MGKLWGVYCVCVCLRKFVCSIMAPNCVMHTEKTWIWCWWISGIISYTFAGKRFDADSPFSKNYCREKIYFELVLVCSGLGFTKPISPIQLFSKFFSIGIAYNIYIWQVSPQLSCGDTCQIWTWFKKSNIYFCIIENRACREINEQSALVTPLSMVYLSMMLAEVQASNGASPTATTLTLLWLQII